MNWLLLLKALSTTGFLISLYFLGVYKGWIHSSTVLLPPSVCSKNSCNAVLGNPFARVFHIPNFYLGIMYYVILLVSPTSIVLQFQEGFVLASWLVVVFSVYLAHALIFRLKINCVLCFLSHAVNVGIAVALTQASSPF